MRTKRELVGAALGQLRIVGIGETPSAEDYANVADAYDDLHAELGDVGLCYWPNTGNDVEEIPTAIHNALVSIVAHDVADSYGKEPGTVQGEDGRVVSDRVYGMRQLRRHISRRPSGEATPFSSY